jgi:pseudouridine-5'-phosphate glycosidase/pseudouridine kinase
LPRHSYQTDEVPAFFTPNSGHKAPLRVDTPDEVGALLDAQQRLGVRSGIVVAVPVPAEHAADAARVERVTQQALNDAEAAHVAGRQLTPFLLARVAELSGGESLRANIQLVLNNARVGTQIAIAYAKQRQQQQQQQQASSSCAAVVTIGGMVCDVVARPQRGALARDSHPGGVKLSGGGVARNVAHALAVGGVDVALVSAVGDDVFGRFVVDVTRRAGVNVDAVRVVPHRATAVYNALLDVDGEMQHAVADMAIFDEISGDGAPLDAATRFVVLDGNVGTACVDAVARRCVARSIAVWFEPTSATKSIKVCRPARHLLFPTLAPDPFRIVYQFFVGNRYCISEYCRIERVGGSCCQVAA